MCVWNILMGRCVVVRCLSRRRLLYRTSCNDEFLTVRTFCINKYGTGKRKWA